MTGVQWNGQRTVVCIIEFHPELHCVACHGLKGSLIAIQLKPVTVTYGAVHTLGSAICLKSYRSLQVSSALLLNDSRL
jgi:hypothetical protein